jgi:phosphoserine phosphatase
MNGQRLVVLDMDSTFIQQEVIDLLAAHAGVGEEVAAITERSMRGDVDFSASLAQRVALLKGLPVEIFDQVRREISLSRGAQEMVDQLHAAGHKVAVVSGGFENIIHPILRTAGVDYFRANHLESVDGVLTGRTTGALITSSGKAEFLKEIALQLGIPLSQTVAVGDGANDLGMMAIAGLSIAFNAKPKVQAAAMHSINDGNLLQVLGLMGITEQN